MQVAEDCVEIIAIREEETSESRKALFIDNLFLKNKSINETYVIGTEDESYKFLGA